MRAAKVVQFPITPAIRSRRHNRRIIAEKVTKQDYSVGASRAEKSEAKKMLVEVLDGMNKGDINPAGVFLVMRETTKGEKMERIRYFYRGLSDIEVAGILSTCLRNFP